MIIHTYHAYRVYTLIKNYHIIFSQCIITLEIIIGRVLYQLFSRGRWHHVLIPMSICIFILLIIICARGWCIYTLLICIYLLLRLRSSITILLNLSQLPRIILIIYLRGCLQHFLRCWCIYSILVVLCLLHDVCLFYIMFFTFCIVCILWCDEMWVYIFDLD